MDVFNQAQTGLKHQAKRLDVFPPSIDAKSRSHGRMALSLHFEDPSFQGLSSLTSDLNKVQAVHGSPQQVWHLTTLLSGVSATWQPNPCPFCFLALVSGDKAGNPPSSGSKNLTSQEALPADSFRGPIYGRLF